MPLSLTDVRRFMSDYEVTLVNDNSMPALPLPPLPPCPQTTD